MFASYFIQYQSHIHRIHFYVILRCVLDANTRKNFVSAWKMTIRRLTAGISFHSSTPLLVSWSLQSAARMSSSELRDRSFCTHKSWPYIIITRGQEIGEKIAFEDNCSKKKKHCLVSSTVSAIVNFIKYIMLPGGHSNDVIAQQCT